jgi:hypothetical protein
MAEKNHAGNTDVSNWTLATATKPGERHVYSGNTNNAARHVLPRAA